MRNSKDQRSRVLYPILSVLVLEQLYDCNVIESTMVVCLLVCFFLNGDFTPVRTV